VRWPTSSRRSSARPARSLSREEVLARQTPPYAVQYGDPWDDQWQTLLTSPSFGFAFKKYAELGSVDKRLINGDGKVIVYEVSQ
jgi:hypothetical protein